MGVVNTCYFSGEIVCPESLPIKSKTPNISQLRPSTPLPISFSFATPVPGAPIAVLSGIMALSCPVWGVILVYWVPHSRNKLKMFRGAHTQYGRTDGRTDYQIQASKVGVWSFIIDIIFSCSTSEAWYQVRVSAIPPHTEHPPIIAPKMGWGTNNQTTSLLPSTSESILSEKNFLLASSDLAAVQYYNTIQYNTAIQYSNTIQYSYAWATFF